MERWVVLGYDENLDRFKEFGVFNSSEEAHKRYYELDCFVIDEDGEWDLAVEIKED